MLPETEELPQLEHGEPPQPWRGKSSTCAVNAGVCTTVGGAVHVPLQLEGVLLALAYAAIAATACTEASLVRATTLTLVLGHQGLHQAAGSPPAATTAVLLIS
jgi:hypothetical protein